jgi:hypothetical protein
MNRRNLLGTIWIAIGLLVIAGCAPRAMPPLLVPDTSSAVPTPTTLPAGQPVTSKEECLALGGTWGPQGMLQLDMCDLPTTDAGQPCNDSSQCEGMCLAGDTPEVGACSPTTLNFGCFPIMEGGQQLTICVD